MNFTLRCAASVSALAVSLAMPAIGHAQTESVEPSGLRDIVVTARRVEERLQDVPLSITAMDAKSLEDNQIGQVQDLAAQVPNLITARTSVPGAGQIAIRGVQGQGLPRIGLDTRVGVYLDGVYLARQQGQSFNLADIERIEVLKGPQGTLFGRNVTAGSINIITAAPTGELGAKFDAGLGSRDRKRFRATLELPEAGGFSARITYLHEEQDGDIKNLAAGNTIAPVVLSIPAQAARAAIAPGYLPATFGATAGGDAAPAAAGFNYTFTPRPAAKTLNAMNSESLFAAVRYEGIDGLTADYKFDWTKEHTTFANGLTTGFSPDFGNGCFSAAIALGANTNQCGAGIETAIYLSAAALTANTPTWIPFPGVAGTGVVSTAPTITGSSARTGYLLASGAQNFTLGNRRPDVVSLEGLYGADVKSMGHNLTLNYEASDSINLRSITAYRSLKTFSQGDQDGGQFTLNNAAMNAVLAAPGGNPNGLPLYPAVGTTGYPLAFAYQFQKQTQFSQELQAFGKINDWADFLVGLYYFREKGTSLQFTINTNASTSSGFQQTIRGQNGIPPYSATINNWGIGAQVAGDNARVTSSSKAIFGRLTVRPMEALEIVVGARYTRDKKTQAIPQYQANLLDANPATAYRDQPSTFYNRSFGKFTWDATATYHVTQDINVYGRYATAYLAGGALRNIPFQPESSKAAEIGLKSELFDRRVRFNAAGFWQKTNNAQNTPVGGFTTFLPGAATPTTVTATTVQNLGSVRTRGFEAELTAMPLDGLTLSGSVGYVDIKYVAPASIVPIRPQAPSWTAQTSAQYDTPPLLGDAYMSFRVDANYRSKYDGSLRAPIAAGNFACPPGIRDVANPAIPQSGNNCARVPAELLALYGLPNTAAGVNAYAQIADNNIRVGGFWLINARVSMVDIPMFGGKARLSGWVRNLTNNSLGKTYGVNFGVAVMNLWNEKRSYGLDLAVDF